MNDLFLSHKKQFTQYVFEDDQSENGTMDEYPSSRFLLIAK